MPGFGRTCVGGVGVKGEGVEEEEGENEGEGDVIRLLRLGLLGLLQ